MRKASKTTTRAELNRVQSYHEGGYGLANREQYAYIGFKSNKYFTSDRFIPLTSDYKRADGKQMRGYGLEIETECIGVHNQIAYNDTARFISEYMAFLVRSKKDMQDPRILEAIENLTSSKWALLYKDGTISMVGNFIREENGLFFSNPSYRGVAKITFPRVKSLYLSEL